MKSKTHFGNTLSLTFSLRSISNFGTLSCLPVHTMSAVKGRTEEKEGEGEGEEEEEEGEEEEEEEEVYL